MSVSCGCVDIRRPRSGSLGEPGRFGAGFGLAELEILGTSEHLQVVRRHMFLEVLLIEEFDQVNQDDSGSKFVSDMSTASWASSVDTESVSDWVSGDECDSVEISDDEEDIGRHCPSGVVLEASAGVDASAQTHFGRCANFTSLSVRSLPPDCTGYALAELLNLLGFGGQYDFVYAPVDFHDGKALRYATVNMVSHEVAVAALRRLAGFVPYGATDALDTSWNEPLQVLETHIQRYRNSPVMHVAVPDAYKPMIFCNGMRVAFPAPTKMIKKPRLRNNFAHCA